MTTNIDSRIYLQKCLEQAPRILASIDRNPFSPTFGCCDWRFWHDKVSDIPSGHDQEMVYFLALLFDTKDTENPYHGSAWLLRLIEGVLDYWAGMVERRPALDEFYVREAQYGATAIVACAAAETLLLLSEKLPQQCVERTLTALGKSARWLADNDEETDLANHQAQAALAVWIAADLCSDKTLANAYSKKQSRLMSLFHADGWSAEYGYFDPGYQTTCSAFVDRLARLSDSTPLAEFVQASHRLLRFVCLPSHQFGGATGSRKTRHIWPSSFERAAGLCPIAASLARHFRVGLKNSLVHEPTIQDRYAVQQLYDFMICFREGQNEITNWNKLPYEGPPFLYVCESAGLVALKTESDAHLVANSHKGGTFHFVAKHTCDRMGLQLSDNGLAVRTEAGVVLTSDWCGQQFLCEVDESTPIRVKIEGTLSQVRFILPGPIRYLVFRMFMILFGRSDFLRTKFRTILARLLISERPKSTWRFRRVIELDSGSLLIADQITAPSERSARNANMMVGEDASSIYVPISKAFDPAIDMDHMSTRELSGQVTGIIREYKL